MRNLAVLFALLASLVGFTSSTQAKDNYSEITAYLGYQSGQELTDANNQSMDLTASPAFGLSYAWPAGEDEGPGQGQIMFASSIREFDTDANVKNGLMVNYIHFAGVAHLNDSDSNFTTTFGLGFGAAYFVPEESAFANEVYGSLVVSAGTRYELSDNMAFVVEGRMYATLTDKEDGLFCNKDDCVAEQAEEVWVDTQLWAGLAFRF